LTGWTTVSSLRDGRVSFSPARIEVTSDDPIKVEQAGKDRSQNLMPQLRPQFDGARESVMLVSPYFVPRKGGVEFLRSLRARGVRVRVLTNGLASTDVLPVFGKYKKYRRQLLEAGVELYEIDPAHGHDGPAGPQTSDDANATDAKAPRAALHGKVLSFDCLQFFVGSMNLDPRSAFTNTEIGFLVDAPDVPGTLCAGLDETFARGAFRLELTTTSNGARHMEWVRQGTRAALHERAAREPLAALQGVDVRDPADRIADVRRDPARGDVHAAAASLRSAPEVRFRIPKADSLLAAL